MKNIEHIENCNISRYSTFKIGGNARCVWIPKTEEEFLLLLKNLENPVVIGSGSNTLFSSSYIDRDILLTQNLDKYSIEDNILTVEAGVKTPQMVKKLAQEGLSGLEFLIGFPARFGGAIVQNASAQGQAVVDTFLSAKIFDLDKKELKTVEKADMDFDYRHSRLKIYNEILISAKFKLQRKDVTDIANKIQENLEFRKNHQPMLKQPNIGSIFANCGQKSAGKLADECHMKGIKVNNAQVWQNHANFIVNLGDAKAIDVLRLMHQIKQNVKEKFNINLKPEIIFLEGNDEEENKLWKLLKK